MEALLPVFIGVLLAETGGRMQRVANGLGLKFAEHGPLYLGLTISTLLNLGFGAVGGAVIATMIAYDARSLLFGLALVFAGLPMLLRVGSPKIPRSISGLTASLTGFARVQFGDASQFIVFAIAARAGEPLLALLGGLLGVLAAATPAILLGEDWPGKLPLRVIRVAAAIILTLAGVWAAVAALRLI